MRTALIAPCIIRNDDDLKRNQKWINYYSQEAVKEAVGIEDIWLVDNASPDEEIKKLKGVIYNPKLKVLFENEGLHQIVYYRQRFERVEFKIYHYYYRALFTALQTIRKYGNYDKILFIDTDMFVLKKELAEYIKNLNTGWNAFWCPRHEFADSTFQVLCKDSFHLADKFIADSFPIEKYDYLDAEHVLPFTSIIKQFKGDRYGELALPQTSEMCYYGQANLDFEPKWEMT